jgi:type II secretory pathway component PulM
LAQERARQQEEELRTREAKQAELRVQLQEEAKARAAEQQRLLEHEKEMAAITAVERAKIRARRIIAGGAVFLVLASLGGYALVLKPALERQAMAEEMAKQEQRRAAMDKEQAEAALLTETERAQAAERDKEALKARLEEKEQARHTAPATPNKPKARPVKKAGCAPDDPLCGIPLD